MKKVTRKLSQDNVWALEQISKNQELGSLDSTLRFILSFYNKIIKIAQNHPNQENSILKTTKETKNAKKT